MKERLAQLAAESGLTRAAFARRIGISPQNLNGLLHGAHQVRVELARRISRAFGVSAAWVLFGDEESPERAQLRRLSASLRKAGIDPQQLAAADEETEARSTGMTVAELRARYPRRLRMPVVGRASASGEPNVIWEPVEPPEWAELPEGATCIEVKGDSMRPLVRDGQKVIAAPMEGEPEDRALVVAELADGRQVFKRWWSGDRGRVVLESLRSDVSEKPIEVTRRQVRRIWRIVGVLF